jgi:glycosyltransferase involved in cell wall biosynthesis
VIVPVRNEAAHLRAAVDAVLAQDYPGILRVTLAVAPSGDGTEDVAHALAEEDRRVTVVANPAGITPAALNAAIAAGSAPVIVRVDGHSELSPGYVERAVATMRRTGAVNVGGLQVPVATTPFEEAVAAATTSLLGTGGPSYRVGGVEGPTDTVYLGVFDRRAVEALGGFDERLIRNQDYELNVRLRKSGGTIWFDPHLAVGYRPRGSWVALARQYYDYGRYKALVMRLHPDSVRLRQVVPPVAVAAVAAALVVAPRRRSALLVPAGYAAALAVAAARARRPARPLLVAGTLACIHASWAAGLLTGLLAGPLPPRKMPGSVRSERRT